MSGKSILSIIFAVVIVAAVYGAYQYPHSESVTQSFGTTSGTAGTRHIAQFSFNPTTASATTSSILNSDGQDRVVTSVDVACSGLGTSRVAYTGGGLTSLGLLFSVATTAASAPAALGNTNFTYGPGGIATTSATFWEASSTPGTTGVTIDASRRWAAGSYMTISSNATNTAACFVDVNYLQGLGI